MLWDPEKRTWLLLWALQARKQSLDAELMLGVREKEESMVPLRCDIQMTKRTDGGAEGDAKSVVLTEHKDGGVLDHRLSLKISWSHRREWDHWGDLKERNEESRQNERNKTIHTRDGKEQEEREEDIQRLCGNWGQHEKGVRREWICFKSYKELREDAAEKRPLHGDEGQGFFISQGSWWQRIQTSSGQLQQKRVC